MISEEIKCKIGGKEYQFVRGMLYEIRLAGIPKEIRDSLDGLAYGTMVLWAAVKTMPNPFPTWEHLAAAILQEELTGIYNAINSLLEPLSQEKKSSSESGPSPVTPSS